MRDRREKNYELHEIARSRSAGANINSGSRELANLAPANAEVSPPDSAAIVVIDKRALVRECLTRCLKAASGNTVVSFPSVDSWLEVCDDISASLILLCIVGKPSDPETQREISRLSQQGNQLPTILLSDVEDPDQIVDAIGRGARGYVPTSASFQVVIEVMRLVRAGGVFVPASSLIAARRSSDSITASQQSANGLFTTRQAAVVEALRRGKANKIIAYELNMRESTVKVHIRNIMKKLKARNRTEVAFMTNELMHNGGAV
jgi:DNA-binding NarL/FixJ family response regulator